MLQKELAPGHGAGSAEEGQRARHGVLRSPRWPGRAHAQRPVRPGEVEGPFVTQGD